MNTLKGRAAQARLAVARRVKGLVGSEGRMQQARVEEARVEEAQRDLKQAQARVRQQQKQIKALRDELADARGAPTSGAEAPVFFLIGRSKSGTGWLMRLLNLHPEVMCRGEGHFFGREKMNSKRAQMQETTEGVRSMPVASSLYYALAESEWLRLWIERSVWGRKDDAAKHTRNLMRLTINYFMEYELAKTRKKVVGDKSPLQTPGIVPEISGIYPGARVIHIVRDGRDQVVSLIHHYWKYSEDRDGIINLEQEDLSRRDAYEEDPESHLASGKSIFAEERLRQVARQWAEATLDACENGRNLLGDDYAEVKYEDLLTRPEEEARRLFEFLEVRADEQAVGRCVERASFERLSGKERGQEDAGTKWRKYRKGIAGDWKNVFTERDKEIFKEEAGETLVKLGYERDLDW